MLRRFPLFPQAYPSTWSLFAIRRYSWPFFDLGRERKKNNKIKYIQVTAYSIQHTTTRTPKSQPTGQVHPFIYCVFTLLPVELEKIPNPVNVHYHLPRKAPSHSVLRIQRASSHSTKPKFLFRRVHATLTGASVILLPRATPH